MAGDEITAEWLGDLFAVRVAVTTAPQRFHATSRRFKTVKIFNPDSANYVHIGKFYTDIAIFENNAIPLFALKTIEFDFTDIYNLGYADSTGSASFAKLIGINQY